MNTFAIQSNEYLDSDIIGFYHSNYQGGGNWRVSGTIENLICTLKNDITPYPSHVLSSATSRLYDILNDDFLQISRNRRSIGISKLTVCVIPRAKSEDSYRANQKLFRNTVQRVVQNYPAIFEDGTHYIIRHTDTRTTHLARSGHGGTGDLPYQGITEETCHISEMIEGKDILLVDDLYTRTVNIDEDAIQALLENGANSVCFYAVGKTISLY